MAEEKNSYQFGVIDKGVLFSILLASLFLTAMVGHAALDAAISPALNDGVKGDEDGGNVPIATGVAVAVGLVFVSECFTITLVLIVLTAVSYTIYRLVSYLDQKCKNMCKCKWSKPWCCLGKLICWAIWVLKWVAVVVTVILAVATVVSFIYCIWHVVTGY